MSIRCTPFCCPCDKGYKHHELLVALLNTKDDEFSDDAERESLKKLIDKHKANGWDINSEILEENEEFRFPLLHWACVLGKIHTVRWLLDNGFSPTVRKKDTLETCLHRALMTLPDLASTKSGRLSVLRFEQILPYFRECLAMGDHRQDTPLHIAAQFMVHNRCYTLYENLFMTMLAEIKKMPLASQHMCVNAQNGSGDTVINLLSSGCKSLTVIEKLLEAGADSMIVNKLNIGPLDNAERKGLVHIANFLRSSVLTSCGVYPSDTEHRNNLRNEQVRKRRSTYYSTLSSLSMFCQQEARSLNKSLETQQMSSPTKESEKSTKSSENVEVENIDTITTEDEETSSQSSHISSVINNVSDNDFAPTASEQPPALEKSTDSISEMLPPAEQSTTTQMKHDDDDVEICTCCEDENDNAIPIAAHKKDLNTRVSDSELKLFDVMKEAGVLPNLADVITRTKEGHLTRLQTLENAMNEIDGKQMVDRKKEKSLQREVAQKKREIEKLNSELYNIRRRSVSASNKRKLMEEESQDLRKKLVSCETLLKTVPKDT